MTSTYPAHNDQDAQSVVGTFEAVVLDLDGVITDTAAIHALAWKRAMDQLLVSRDENAQPFDEVAEYREHIDGRPRLEGAAAFLESRGIRLPEGSSQDPPGMATLWGVTTLKNDAFLTELERRGVQVFPDARFLLDQLVELGLPRAVVTASENGATVLTQAGLADRFDATVTGVEAKHWNLPGKPEPDTYLRAAELLGVRPRACIVIEDAVAGVQAGRAGGFGLVVGVDRDHRGDELARHGADVVLKDLTELLELTVDELAGHPGRSLDRLFEAILICPEPGADRRQVAAAVGEVRGHGTLVAVAGPDPVSSLVSLVDRAARAGVGASLVLAVGWIDAVTLPERARAATVLSVAERPADRRPGTHATRWLGGGWQALRAVLDDQAHRRRTARVPVAPADPRWSLVVRGDDQRPVRVQQSLLTVADTRFGTRGTREEDRIVSVPGVVAAGVFDESVDPPALLEGPGWTALQVDGPIDPTEDVRTFDLRSGVLYRDQPAVPLPMRSARFASLARPGVQALRAEGPVQWLHPGPSLTPPVADGSFTRRQAASRTWATSSSDAGGQISAVAAQHESLGEGSAQPVRVVERIVALTASPHGAPDADAAQQLLDQATGMGFDRLLSEQRRAWALRWADAEIGIEGDPDNELAVRFALFHLMAAAPVTGEAAIGPRGLSGPTYKGHVFWDADVFGLPFLAATCPRAAQAMLRYRVRRLPEARRIASAQGMSGARFPWESARIGSDVTPTHAVSLEGAVPILTGRYEEHITADVAWAAWQLVEWTGRTDLLDGPLGTLLVDTARYWASRARLAPDGRGHIDAVMGPDEYHELVDDNAFTNVMARWNLRAAAGLAGRPHGPDPREAQGWTALADSLVDNLDRQTQVYEQFTGYFDLEALLVSDIAEPPVAVDLLLGRGRIARSQVIKQPDVLMLHHLVPDEVAEGSLQPNLDFYLPRCAHGSSLSPAIHASLLARAGRPDEAMHLFDMACRLDLADLTGTAAGGLHMATFGGVWQAVVNGFAGIRPQAAHLVVDPQLPSRWSELRVRVRFRGVRIAVVLRHDEVRLIPEGMVDVLVPGSAITQVGPTGAIWRRTKHEWRLS